MLSLGVLNPFEKAPLLASVSRTLQSKQAQALASAPEAPTLSRDCGALIHFHFPGKCECGFQTRRWWEGLSPTAIAFSQA